MSVDTKVYVVKQHDIDDFMFEVVKALKKNFKEKVVSDSIRWRDCNRDRNTEDIFFQLNITLDYECNAFSDNKEHRCVSIFNHPKREMQRDFYELHVGVWGHNKEIAKCLVDYFGGYADYSDCDDIKIDYCVTQPQSFLGIKE